MKARKADIANRKSGLLVAVPCPTLTGGQRKSCQKTPRKPTTATISKFTKPFTSVHQIICIKQG